MWRGVAHHPGLVCPRAVFVSHEVGSRPALYFVHDHMPGQHSHVYARLFFLWCIGLCPSSVPTDCLLIAY